MTLFGMRTFKTEGIVIKRRNVGEADRLITVFTKDHGKLCIKAKGIRRVPSRRSAHVELLNNSVLTVHGASRYPILTEAAANETFSELKEDLQKIGYAYHICELVDGLCPENQEHRNIYNLLKVTLGSLSRCYPDPLDYTRGKLREESSVISNGVRDLRGISPSPKAGRNDSWTDDIFSIVHDFEVELLTLLGYWHRPTSVSQSIDLHSFIENILERKLKSKRVFVKLS